MDYVFILIAEHPWLVTIIVALIQSYFFYKTEKKLLGLRKFFEGLDKCSIKDDLIKYPEIGIGKQFKVLVDNINKYLAKCEGAVENVVLQNKTDRIITSTIEDATARVSFPTLIGLMGTFLGVLCGLVAFNAGLNPGEGVESKVTDEHISELIQGVVIAMTTSLLGLLFMTISNHRAAKTKKMLDDKKMDFFDFIQSELIPTVNTDMVSAVNSLNRTIKGFLQNQTKTLKEIFVVGLDKFDKVFNDGVVNISNTVMKMGDNIETVNNSIHLQEKLVSTMRSPEITATLDNFVAVAHSFANATTTFQQLEQYKSDIVTATSNLVVKQNDFLNAVEIPRIIVERMSSLLDRFSKFEASINALGENVAQTQLLGNQEMNMITEHLEAIQRKAILGQQFHGIANDKLENFYADQLDHFKSLTISFERLLGEYETEFETMMKNVQAELQQKKDGLLQVLTEAFNLDDVHKDFLHLQKLENIKATVESIDENIKSNPGQSGEHFTDLKAAIDEIPKSLNSRLNTISSEIRELKGKVDTLSRGTGPIQSKSFWDKLLGK